MTIFEAFITPPEVQLMSGEKAKKIKINRPARKEKRLSEVHGTIGVNLLAGTTVSSATGDIIDPTKIDILPTSLAIQKK